MPQPFEVRIPENDGPVRAIKGSWSLRTAAGDSTPFSAGISLNRYKTMSPVATAKKKRDFDPNTFLATIAEGRKTTGDY
jgi:hypothetical protein